MKKLIIILFALIGLSGSSRSYAQSLEASLKIAAENNPFLKAKYAEFEAALQRVAQVNGLPDPTISFGYFVLPVETRVGPQLAKIGLNQMFPWFGTLKSAGQIQTLNAESKYQLFVQARNELFYEVKSVWYELYLTHQEIELQIENKSLLESYKQVATTGFRNNKNSMTDVLRADISLDNVKTEIQILESELRPLCIQFNRLLNRSDSIDFKVDHDLNTPSVPLNYRRDSLISNHPMIQSLDAKKEMFDETLQLSRLQGLPKFGVGLDYVFVGKRTDMQVPGNGSDILMPMVSMTLPINRSKYKASALEAEFNKESIVQYRKNLENSLFADYEAASFEVERALQLIDLYTAQILKTNQMLKLLETAYSNSGKEFEEVLRVHQEIIKLKIASAKVTKDYYMSLAKLDLLTSKSI